MTTPTVCPACGFRLDVDRCPCGLCRTGWGMHGLNGDGTMTSSSCRDTCPDLKAWQERQRKTVGEGEKA